MRTSWSPKDGLKPVSTLVDYDFSDEGILQKSKLLFMELNTNIAGPRVRENKDPRRIQSNSLLVSITMVQYHHRLNSLKKHIILPVIILPFLWFTNLNKIYLISLLQKLTKMQSSGSVFLSEARL